MISSKRSLLVIAALAAISSSSYATIITNGGAVLAAPVLPVLGGITVDTNGLPFAATDGVFNGIENTTVVAGEGNNPSGLTFIYQVTNSPTSADALDRVTLSGFAGFITDVGYVPFAGAALPVVITRSTDGGTIGFDFSTFGLPDDDVAPGQTTALLVIRTNAVFDAPNILSVIDGGTGSVASFGPAPSGGGGTPEPASLGLMSLGGVALLRRRRSR